MLTNVFFVAALLVGITWRR